MPEPMRSYPYLVHAVIGGRCRPAIVVEDVYGDGHMVDAWVFGDEAKVERGLEHSPHRRERTYHLMRECPGPGGEATNPRDPRGDGDAAEGPKSGGAMPTYGSGRVVDVTLHDSVGVNPRG
jgi:hypothetical protein